MEGPNSGSNRQFFKTDQKKGQAPSAAEARKIGAALNKLTGAPRQPTKTYSRVRLVKPAEVMGTFANESKESRADRTAKLQYWDANAKALAEKTGNADKTTCCDPYGLVYDIDEPLAMLYLEQAGVHVPLNPRTVRHAITWPETNDDGSSDGACDGIAGAEYPAESDGPTVYPIKFVRLEYEESAGRHQASVSYLSDTLCHDAHVFNLSEDVFIPPYTLIQIYSVVGKDGKPQWFTATCCVPDNSSSSSSVSLSESSASASSVSASSASESSQSQSSSASSQSASSLSSQSLSSQSLSSQSISLSSASSSPSSQSASSQSSQSASSASSVSVSLSSASSGASSASSSQESSASSGGSSASSSGGSSASSAGSSASSDESSQGSSASSDQSSGGSSASSGGSDASSMSISQSEGFVCFNPITSLSFDDASCVLTYCTTRVCFPAGLGITIDDEVC